MSFSPSGIQIGAVLLNTFGLILLAALLIGGVFARIRARAHGEDISLVLDFATWALLAGVIAARAEYVLNPPPSVAEVYDRAWLLDHPFDLQVGPLAIWSGGLGMAGALIGGLLGIVVTLFKRRVDRWQWGDILTPAVLLGMLIAAWANVATQQMFGPPTTLLWGLKLAHPIPPYSPETRFHPTPAYVAIWALICLIVVLWIERRGHLRKGAVTLIGALLYLPGLFLADFLRVDVNRVILGLTAMQVVTLVLFVGAGVMVWLRRRDPARVSNESPMESVSILDAG